MRFRIISTRVGRFLPIHSKNHGNYPVSADTAEIWEKGQKLNLGKIAMKIPNQ